MRVVNQVVVIHQVVDNKYFIGKYIDKARKGRSENYSMKKREIRNYKKTVKVNPDS